MFNDEELKIFADGYTKNDFSMIECDSQDPFANYDFRIALSEFAVKNIDTVNTDLIADLFLENAKSSKHTFSVYNKLNVLAQKLLTHDWKKYLDVYMEGARMSFDTALATGNIKLDVQKASEIYKYVVGLPEPEKHELFIMRFQHLMTIS